MSTTQDDSHEVDFVYQHYDLKVYRCRTNSWPLEHVLS